MIPGLAKELRASTSPSSASCRVSSAPSAWPPSSASRFDASKALPVENPGRVCAMLATAADPMVFSGRDVDGPTFYAEHAGARSRRRRGAKTARGTPGRERAVGCSGCRR